MTAVTKNLRDLLRDRFPPPEWAIAFEVQAERDEGGLSFADAVAIRTRKGQVELHGFELKVSRSDWLAELENPGKGQATRDLVDYWWLVLGAVDVAGDDEVPEKWGIMQPGPTGALEIWRPASRLCRGGNVERGLLAAFLRRLDPMEPRAYWEGRERRAEQKGYAKGRNARMALERKRNREGIPDRDGWPVQ